MAIRIVRLENDLILRKKSKPVKNINDKIKTLLDDMIETMIEKNGVGLAAPQVGNLRRIVVVKIDIEEDGTIYELINPEILEKKGNQINKEACLSVPGYSGYVDRPEYLKVKALNRNGEEIIIEAEDFLAIAFSHEIDHLDGILYVDKEIPEEDLEFEDDDETPEI